MFANAAYLGVPHEDIVDTTRPLLVTAAGNYRMHKNYVYETDRPQGRGDYQLYYVASGKAHFFFDGKEKIISKGNIVLFRPGDPQKYNIYASEKPETYWVHFTGGEVETLLDHYRFPKGESLFYTGSSQDYQHIFGQMIRELQLRRTNFQDLLSLNIRTLLLMINRHLTESKNARAQVLDEIEKSIHYFNENYNKPIIIEDYAEQHLMTPCWFIQNFKQLTKTTPMQYIVNLRLTNAMNMLENKNYNIAQIASAVGYDNPLYFSRLFKKHTGLSPSEYRNNLQKQI
ncbi:MAG: helix-turn-helix transcriptional regulator [Clostridia bacterium]|nr:helix-turn-helix transcriptional regulator [Clostridia bacterium]